MSSRMSKSLANGKPGKQLEESHLKLLRELSHIAGNRHCFDCGQRGPTYVNVTIGSFVCMACSGLLRGLTPPHRVKSISMASFQPEEIELLKSRGNDYCRKVWLATCTSKDSHIGSEKDPDRLNSLRSFMSAKYEQKRYYVDPSKLPQSELNDIQAQTAKALSSSSSSISNSSASAMQKSPSLSSASSASSLSLHNQNNPSPVLNNSRNNSQINSQNRLVNSITLPDIKPLSSLLGPVNLTPSSSATTTATNHINGSKSNNLIGGSLNLPNGKLAATPVPINFINNLSSSSLTSQQNLGKSGANGGNCVPSNDPWESENNNFNANFADFDNFNSNDQGSHDPNDSNFANFDAFHQTLVPANNSFETSGGGANSHAKGAQPLSTNNEDKYAALKDLDNIFKQGINGESTGNGYAGNNGITSSASYPANLSSSTGGASAGWFSSSPNQQGGHSTGIPNGGWTVNGASGSNPRNPFFNNVSPWQSSAASNSLLSTSPSASCFQTIGTSPAISNGFANPSGVVKGSTNLDGLFSNGSNGVFGNQLQAVSSSVNKVVANPFISAAMTTPSVNPNNPFL